MRNLTKNMTPLVPKQLYLGVNQQAHAYVRRRVLNAVVLMLANLLAWAVIAPCAHRLGAHWGWAFFPAKVWIGLFVLHTGLMYAQRLLPGWGVGVVNELRRMVNTGILVSGVALLADLIDADQSLEAFPLILLTFLPLIAATLLARILAKKLLLSIKAWGTPAVIYGAGQTGQMVVQALHSEPGLGYLPIAYFDDDPAKLGQMVAGLPVVGKTTEVQVAAPVAILAMPGLNAKQHSALLDSSLAFYRTVIVMPDLVDAQTLWATPTDLGGLLGIEMNHTLIDPWQRRLKRLFDLVAVGLSAIIWVPICLLIALLIWLEDREKPIFLQTRVGLGGRAFDTWKFRTMVPQAESILQERLAADPALKAEWEQNFKLKRDPRITRIGNLLRKTSLDELPQLVNVWRGEMSLVGPRPLPKYHQQELPENVQKLRVKVRPGMTGLWQVSGRSDAGNEGMIQLDPYYVRNWSGWLDLVILFRTFRAVLRSAGAY